METADALQLAGIPIASQNGMIGFLFGAIAGGVATYFWRDQIRHYFTDRVPDMRQRAAEGLGTVGERAGDALERVKSRLDTTVRTTQDRLRTSGAGSDERRPESSPGISSSPGMPSAPDVARHGQPPTRETPPSPRSGSGL